MSQHKIGVHVDKVGRGWGDRASRDLRTSQLSSSLATPHQFSLSHPAAIRHGVPTCTLPAAGQVAGTLFKGATETAKIVAPDLAAGQVGASGRNRQGRRCLHTTGISEFQRNTRELDCACALLSCQAGPDGCQRHSASPAHAVHRPCDRHRPAASPQAQQEVKRCLGQGPGLRLGLADCRVVEATFSLLPQFAFKCCCNDQDVLLDRPHHDA